MIDQESLIFDRLLKLTLLKEKSLVTKMDEPQGGGGYFLIKIVKELQYFTQKCQCAPRNFFSQK